MNRVKLSLLKMLFFILIILVGIFGVIFINKKAIVEQTNMQNGLPDAISSVEVVYEEKAGSSLDAIIVIPSKYFNRRDMAAIFKWYSNHKTDISIVRVHLYTNKSRANPLNFDNPPPRNLCKYDAAYLKHSRINNKGIKVINERFEYRRILAIPVCSNKVVME